MGTDEYGGKGSPQAADAAATQSAPVLPPTADAEAEAKREQLAADHADAKSAVADAEAALREAKEKEVAAAEAAKPQPDPHKEVLIDLGATGNHSIVAIPADSALNSDGLCRERSLTVSGRRVEHTGEQIVIKDGKPYVVWVYREM